MKQDDCYQNLQVKKNLHANVIYASKLVLDDATLSSTTHLLGNDVKQLYESQRNTNCFTDENKKTLQSLSTTISTSSEIVYVKTIPVFHLPNVREVHDSLLHNQSYCICSSDDGKLMYRTKMNNLVKDYYFHVYEPYVKVILNITGDYVNVILFSSESSML
jgi:hypothetical protein